MTDNPADNVRNTPVLTSLNPLQPTESATQALTQAWGPLGEYVADSMQRTILFWDVLRQRSDQYYAQKA
ncbi:MAG TPA: hypothetical protein PKA43_10195, partial [Candidatus Competibacter phosphatis]|nr:hypothetical protein [Candidatus Competibacter phosphatis]